MYVEDLGGIQELLAVKISWKSNLCSVKLVILKWLAMCELFELHGEESRVDHAAHGIGNVDCPAGIDKKT